MVSGFGTQAECDTEMTRYRTSVTVLDDNGKPTIVQESKPTNPESPKPVYQCLPETVDPRGAKGK
jgi:hypothetical protein